MLLAPSSHVLLCLTQFTWHNGISNLVSLITKTKLGLLAGMTATKVLIDGGAGLNIIFSETLRKMGLDFTGLITPNRNTILWNSTRQSCHATRVNHSTSHVWNTSKLPNRIHSVWSCGLWDIISRHPWKTNTCKVHGYTSLPIPPAQDARTSRNTLPPGPKHRQSTTEKKLPQSLHKWTWKS
jgi:hypothetical protein